MNLFRKVLFLVFLTFVSQKTLLAQTTLVAGDIAITGYQGFGASATTDEFSFVLLRNVTAGTVINFTDNGWLSTNVFRTGETTVTWTAVTALNAGTEVKIVGLTPTLAGAGNPGSVTGTALSLSANGDQILAYQGTTGSPTFITAIHMNVYSLTNGDPVTTTAAAWDGTANTLFSSAVPTGLTNGVNAIWIGTQGDINSERDNARFVCAGDLSTAVSIKGLIFDQTKWTTSDGDPSGLILPTGCSYITAAAAPTINTNPSSAAICAGANTSFSITATGAVTYQWQENNGGGFVNITNNVIYSGATTTTLNITAAPVGYNGYLYRCIATNGTGSTNSTSATLTVNALPTTPSLLAKAPNTNTVADGTSVSATFNAGSGGTGCSDDYRYTTDGGSTYLPYTPGSNISTTGLAAGTGVVTIEGRRANCSAGCQGNYVALATWIVTPLPASATTLNPGDIAFSSYAAITDEFSFVLLKNIGAGTVINFTNNGWLSTNTFRTGEESITWTSNAAYAAGTEIEISGLTATLQNGGSAGTVTGTALTLNITGDQILAYRGTVGSPTFISAIHMNVYSTSNGDPVTTTAAAWDGTAPSSINASALPTGLTTGVNAIWIGTQGEIGSEFDNSRYASCSAPGTLGPIATLRTALNNQANWSSNNNSLSPGFAIPTGCNYLGLTAPPNITGQPANANICSGANTSFTVTATGASAYQWQVNTGSGFNNITDDAVYSGSTTATLNLTAVPAGYNGYTYQCIVSNGSGSVATNTVTLTLSVVPTAPTLATKTPAAGSVADGTAVSATFNAGSGGTGCSDDYRYTTDGGATYLPYTPGSNISTTGLAAGSGWVFIEGRRANCSAGCQGQYTVLASWYVTPLPASATTLNAGDIAFTGYTSTTTNSDFSFVLLRNVGPGTTINFTDNGWLSTNVFRTGETTVTWTAPAGGLTAGTEITIAGLTATKAGGGAAGTVTGTALALSQIGDQILAYRGIPSSPTFISAIHMNVYSVGNGDPVTTTAAAWDGTANTTSSSALPTGLTTGVNAIWIGTQGVVSSEFMNARYGNCGAPGIAGPFSGLRSALNNQTNWISNNSTPPGFTLPVNCNFLGLQAPVINNAGSLTAFTSCSGTASAEQSFTVSGNNLTSNITITAPTGFEVSTTSGSSFNSFVSLTPSSGAVANTTIYVRMAATASGTPSGNITLASVGVTTVNIAVSGTVNSIPATPTITPGGPTTFCSGGSVTLTSPSATGNVWSNGATTQSIIVTTSGTYTVTVSSGGCSSAASTGTTVTVNPTPATPTITLGGPTTFCSGGSVTLTSSSATDNVWSNGETTQSIIVTTSGTYTVTVTSGGCSSAASAGTSVTVNPTPATPTITPGGPTTFCSGGSVTLTSSSATDNVWSNGATTQSIIVTTSGTYTVTVTSSGCSSAPSTGTTVTVNASPTTANAGPNQNNICLGTPNITLGGNSPSNGTGNWTQTSGPVTATITAVGSPTSTVSGLTAAGTYTFRWSIANAGCTTSTDDVDIIVVNPNVTDPSDQELCNNATTTAVTFSGTQPGTVFNWVNNTPSIGLAASGTGNIGAFTATNTTNAPVVATVTVTPTLGVSSGLIPEILYYKFDGSGSTVPNLASAPPAGTATANIMGGLTQGSSSLCNGSLIGTGNSSTTDYLNTGWAPNLGTGSWTISFKSANITPSGTLYYIFGDVNTNSFRCFTNGVAGPNNWILRGAGINDITISGGATVAPHTNTFVYDATLNNIKAYLDGVLVSTVVQTAPNVTGAGPLKVMGYNTNVGAPLNGNLDEFMIFNRALSPTEISSLVACPTTSCDGTPQTFTYTVNPTPTAIATPSSQTNCGTITPIVLSGNVSGTVFNWTRDNTSTVTGTIGASGSGDISGTLVNTTSSPITVTFTITPVVNGCPGSPITATVLVNAPPTITCPANVSVNTSNGQCNAVVTYGAPTTSGSPAPTLTYTFSGATTGSGNGTGSGSLFNLGVTTVTLTATNTCGTTDCSFTVTVTNNQLPVSGVINDQICAPGGIVNLGASSSGTINWYDALTGGVVVNTGTTFSPNISSTTNYYLESFLHSGTRTPFTMPAQTSTFPGNVRGYWFTAPTNFIITSLFVPTTASSGAQTIAVVKFNGNVPPPVFSATTNAFTTEFITRNNPYSGNIPCNISVQAGEVIGILGYRAGVNSYATGDYNTTIAGFPVQLQRLGMQAPLTSTNPQNLWREFGPTTSISRIEFEYSTTQTCNSAPRVTVTGTVNPSPDAIATPASQTNCGTITPIVLSGSLSGTVFNWTRDNTTTVTGTIGASGSGDISGTLINTTSSPVTVTFTITPVVNGCSGTPITATVLVNGPSTITCPANVSVNTSSGQCNAVVTYGAPTTSGSPAPTLTYTFSGATTGSGNGTGSGSLFNLGVTTVTLTATNTCGTNDCSFTVTVTDNQPPTVVTQDRTIYLNASGTATITAAQVNNGSSDACGIASIGLSQTTFTCANVGANTVTLTVTDVNSNSATGTATITVLDTIRPVVTTQNRTIYLNAAGTATVSALQVNNGSSDACGIASLSLSQSSFTCANVGTPVTVTLTATDVNSNSATGTATITVLDTIRPVVTTQNRTIYLNAAGTATVSALQVNNGSSDACGVASLSLSQTSFTCANVGPNTVTLTVTDLNNNSATGTATITVLDTIRPVVATQNRTIYLNAAGTATISAAQVNNGSSDACGVASLSLSQTLFTCANVGTNTVTLTVTDVNSNSNTGTATITVLDTIRPVLATQNITIYLNAAGTATISAAQVNNGSSDACGIASLSLSQTSFTCANVGTPVTVTLTATDVNNNSSTGTATITVLDTIRPIVNTQNRTIYLNAAGTATISAAQVNNGSSDACGVASISLSQTTFTCANVGTNTVTLTVTDVNSNSATGTATITVLDTIRPVVATQNRTIYLNAAGTATISAAQVNNGSSDACGVASISLSQTTFTCANIGANTVTLTITDVNSNTNTGIATITVLDTIRPIVTAGTIGSCYPTVAAAEAAALAATSAIDNCTITLTETATTAGTCSAVITVTTTDSSGNFTEVTYNTRIDNTPPSLTCPAPVTVCGTAAVPTANIALVTNVTDNCTGPITVTHEGDVVNGFSLIAPYTITRTYRATDGCGNFTDCSQTITVNPIPDALATPSSQTICSTNPITTIALSGAVTGTTYSWTRNNTATVTGIAANGIGNISGTLTNTTSAPVTVTFTIIPSANGCDGAPITATVLVNPTPNAVATPASQTICSANPITTIALSGSVTGTTYSWTRNNTASVTGIAANGTGNISGTLTNTTSAPVTVTFTIIPSANGCDGAPITATVLVNPTPNAVATPASQIICSANPITTIALSGAVTGTTYSWTRNNTAAVTGIAASGTGDIFGTLTNTTVIPIVVTFTITPTANGCVGAPINATVLVNPTPNVVAVANQQLCNGATTNPVNFTGFVSGTTFNWTNSNPSIGLAATGSGNIPAFTATNTTQSVATATITVIPVANGCSGNPITFTIQVNPSPVVSLNAFASVCRNASSFTLSGGSPTTGGTGIYLVNGVPQTVFNPANYTPGTYNIVYQFTNTFGCVRTATQTITVFPIPVTDFVNTTANAQCLTGNTFNFSNTTTGAVSYVWNFGDGTTATTQNATKVYTTAGTFTVTLTATNSNGCVVVRTRTVTVYPQPIKPTVVPVFGFGVRSSVVENNYVWYRNNIAEPNSNVFNFYPQRAGFLQVQVINQFGCSEKSDSLYYIPERNFGVGADEQFAFIYPVPATNNIINVHFNVTTSKPVNYELLTSDGKLLQKGAIPTNSRNFQIDVRKYSSAVYIVKLYDGYKIIRGMVVPVLR